MNEADNATTTPFQQWAARAHQLEDSGRHEMGIPLRDGVELAADVYLPTYADAGPVPAIVQITPYGKDQPSLTADDRKRIDRDLRVEARVAKKKSKSKMGA